MPDFKQSILRRCLLPAALVAVAVLPACNSSTPITIGTGTRAVVQITVEPNPVVATQSTLTGAVSASYKVTLTETNGLGGEIVFVNGSVFDPTTGALVAINYYDSKDMVVFVGKSRIEALETISLTQTANYTLPDLSKAAKLTIAIQLKDDRSNLVNASTLVNIE
jgi:hypothetical protein